MEKITSTPRQLKYKQREFWWAPIIFWIWMAVVVIIWGAFALPYVNRLAEINRMTNNTCKQKTEWDIRNMIQHLQANANLHNGSPIVFLDSNRITDWDIDAIIKWCLAKNKTIAKKETTNSP